MDFRELQDQIEVLYQLKEDGSKDAELGRITGLAASVGHIMTALHMQTTKQLSVGEMRTEIEDEVINLLTFLMGICTYYDIDLGEQFTALQDKVLLALETFRWGAEDD